MAARNVVPALKSVAGLGAGLSMCLLAGGLAEAQAFLVRRIEVPVLPAGQKPLKVLHISDLHLRARHPDAYRFLESLGQLDPDLVVSTGDHVAHQDAIEPMLEALGVLLEKPGAFVFGSNDFVRPHMRNPLGYISRHVSGEHQQDGPNDAAGLLPTERLRGSLSSGGWVSLDEVDTLLHVGGRAIQLRGTGDAHIGKDHYDFVEGPLNPKADFEIGVTHAPYRRVLNAMVDDGFPLILAGHTHGGQVCLPPGRPIVTNCDVDPSHARGLSQWSHAGRSAYLHVSAGMGTSPYAPYRLFCRPEATLLTLVAA